MVLTLYTVKLSATEKEWWCTRKSQKPLIHDPSSLEA